MRFSVSESLVASVSFNVPTPPNLWAAKTPEAEFLILRAVVRAVLEQLAFLSYSP
jgi:hypothetical protein